MAFGVAQIRMLALSFFGRSLLSLGLCFLILLLSTPAVSRRLQLRGTAEKQCVL